MQYKSPAPGGKFLGHVHGHQLIKPSLSQGPKASAPFMVTMALLPHRNPISHSAVSATQGLAQEGSVGFSSLRAPK